MARPETLGSLTDPQWERLQEILERFESAWRSAASFPAIADLNGFLPPNNDDLRPVILQELIKTDLELRARRGVRALLDDYLVAFPELGPAASLPPGLICEEYSARVRLGERPGLSEYRARFPAGFADLERLIQDRPAAAAAPPVESSPVAGTTGGLLKVGSEYRLIELLGKGASGEVWRAEAPGGVEVAIKIVYGSLSRGEAPRELEALAVIKRLRHPFLLPIHAFWQQEDRLIIAMELADGSLAQRSAECRMRQQSMVVNELVRYFREAAEALDYLHTQRVLHRDIKPQNILLLQGHAKVADFGLARLVQQTRQLTQASDVGTPAYTAPEVFWHHRISARSDQYSLAAAYAELRLGRPLFPGRTWFALMQEHLQRLPDLLPLLDAEQQVLRRALAKDPEKRFRSCLDMMQAVRRAVLH